MGPPTSQGDGSSTGQRRYSWSSILPEVAPASDATNRPSIPYELIPSAALCVEEGSHLGGSLPDLGEILVQSLRAGDGLSVAVRGEGLSQGPGTSREPSITYTATPVSGSRASGIPSGAQDRDEGPMPSGAVSRAGDDYARLFPSQTTGPGGGTRSGGRGRPRR